MHLVKAPEFCKLLSPGLGQARTAVLLYAHVHRSEAILPPCVLSHICLPSDTADLCCREAALSCWVLMCNGSQSSLKNPRSELLLCSPHCLPSLSPPQASSPSFYISRNLLWCDKGFGSQEGLLLISYSLINLVKEDTDPGVPQNTSANVPWSGSSFGDQSTASATVCKCRIAAS